MRTIILKSWEEFIVEIKNLRSDHHEFSDRMLFRGQADSDWKLETTLERIIGTEITVKDYYRFAHSAKYKILTLEPLVYKIPDISEFNIWADKNVDDGIFSFHDFPCYEYLVYLRHHGFPSPLMDWTFSIFVAAFFAFNKSDHKQNKNVSIYCFLDRAINHKIYSNRLPIIHSLGQNAIVHPRHIQQQSNYTVCVNYENASSKFVNHEKLLNKVNNNQDLSWKFVLPSSERNLVLKSLNEMNINSYTLFGTIDSLVESIATNELIKNGFS